MNAWRIEVALSSTRMFAWQFLRINGFQTVYAESDRLKADRAAINLTKLFGDRMMFRVTHKNPRRGAFYPAPRPAQ